MTRSPNVTPKTTLCSGKSWSLSNNNKRLRSRYYFVEGNYWLTQSIARPLCNSRATYCTYFIFETRISPQGSVWRGYEFNTRISDANFLIVFYSNHESILLSFRDIITARTTDDLPTTASLHTWPLTGQHKQIIIRICFCIRAIQEPPTLKYWPSLPKLESWRPPAVLNTAWASNFDAHKILMPIQ